MTAQGLIPLFTSAPRLRLVIGANTLAYAIGFNMNVGVDIQTVKVLGSFAGISLEPTMYNVVTGTLQILKLNTASFKKQQAANVVNDPFVGTVTPQVVVPASQAQLTSTTAANSAPLAGSSNSLLATDQLATHLDPKNVLLSRSFDMDVYIEVPSADSVAALIAGSKPAGTGTTTNTWMRISTCRLISRNANITHGQLVNEPMNFQGLLATTMLTGAPDFSLDTLVKDKLG